jgi:sugar phosphate isomerase/epimerase
MEAIFKSFDELGPYCKTHKIKLCLENTGGAPELVCQVSDAICKRYDKDFLGLCFDTGHANMHCKENCLIYAQRYNDRLYMIHAHDNHGEADEHLLPFTGGFDWEGFAQVLARSPYTFPILLESQTKEEDDTEWLKRAFDAGSRLTAMVEKHRNG